MSGDDSRSPSPERSRSKKSSSPPPKKKRPAIASDDDDDDDEEDEDMVIRIDNETIWNNKWSRLWPSITS